MAPDAIKAFRRDQRLSQEALASVLGINRVTLADWERGKAAPPPYLGFALAAIRAGLEAVG